MTTEQDKALELLLAEAPTAESTPQHKENYDSFLTQMASASNPDQNLRAAAMQMRLPEQKVAINESGNLSFSARTAKDRDLPKDFESKRVTTLDRNETVIVGEGGDVQVLNVGLPGFKDQAKRAESMHSTGNRRTANLLNRLSTIDSITDVKERERALIDISGTIDLSLNDRKLELIEQAGMRFNVPDLERRLREAEAADRADPQWDGFQHDSPITATIRQEATKARLNATTEADKLYLTDTVANELVTRKTQSLSLLKSDADTAKEGMTPSELFTSAYGKEDQLAARSFYKAAHGVVGSDEEVLTLVKNNKTLQGLLAGDQSDVLVHAFTQGSSDQGMVRSAVYDMEAAKVGTDRAAKRIEDLDTTYKRLLAVVKADEKELSKYTDLANLPDIQALRAEEQATLGIASTKSASEQKAYKAQLPRRLMQVAQQVAMTKEVDRFLNEQDVEYPTATEPSIAGIVEQAKSGNHSVSWLISQASETPNSATAMRNYLDALWLDKYDSVLLGSSADTQAFIASRVNAQLIGISGDSIVAPRTNLQTYLIDPLNRAGEAVVNFGGEEGDAIRDSLRPTVELPATPFKLVDWLSSPSE